VGFFFVYNQASLRVRWIGTVGLAFYWSVLLRGGTPSWEWRICLSLALSVQLPDLLNALRFWNTVFSNRRKGSYLSLSLLLYQNATVPLGPRSKVIYVWSTYPIMSRIVGKVLWRAFQRYITYGPCDRYMTCRDVFKVNQVPHHVRCRWKGLVKSIPTMHDIRPLWTYHTFIKRFQNV
jgi:hypothetical protein